MVVSLDDCELVSVDSVVAPLLVTLEVGLELESVDVDVDDS